MYVHHYINQHLFIVVVQLLEKIFLWTTYKTLHSTPLIQIHCVTAWKI